MKKKKATRPPIIEFDLEKIIPEFKIIQEKWKKLEPKHPNPNFINKLIKDVKSNLNKTNLPTYLGFAAIMNAASSFDTLKKFINETKAIDYNSILFHTPQSDKIKLFIEYSETFSDKEYWENLSYAYIMQNYKKIPYKTLYNLFSSDRAHRNSLMSEEEISYLKKLPQKVKIFRGGSTTEKKTKKYGISWTLDKKIAENFADVKRLRDKKEMIVHELTIDKKDIIAYLMGRQEEEIIYIHS